MTSDLVIYTARTPGYKTLQRVNPRNAHIRHICFANPEDCPPESGWECHPMPWGFSLFNLPFCREAEFVKMLPDLFLPEEYKISLWVDGDKGDGGDAEKFVAEHLTDPYELVVYEHDRRPQCAYTEAQASARRDSPLELKAQTDHYRAVGFPENYCLVETGILLRRRGDFNLRFGLAVMEQICRFSTRGQVAIPYVLWAMDALDKVKILPGSFRPIWGDIHEG